MSPYDRCQGTLIDAQKGAQTRRNKRDEAARRAQVQKEVRAERAEIQRQVDLERQERTEREQPYIRKKIPRKAKTNAPRQYGKGAAYDSGSDTDDE